MIEMNRVNVINSEEDVVFFTGGIKALHNYIYQRDGVNPTFLVRTDYYKAIFEIGMNYRVPVPELDDIKLSRRYIQRFIQDSMEKEISVFKYCPPVEPQQKLVPDVVLVNMKYYTIIFEVPFKFIKLFAKWCNLCDKLGPLIKEHDDLMKGLNGDKVG